MKAHSRCSRKATPIGLMPTRPKAFVSLESTSSTDFEMLGRAVCGLALVSSGAVAEGMRALDEVNAAVVSGEMKDLVAIGLSCCYMIAACDRVRDYDRAFQWCARLKVFCAKWGLRPLFAVCRTQYASICMWRGAWLEAEQELLAATDELAASRPAMTADGIVRLAELRRRQGKTGRSRIPLRTGRCTSAGHARSAEIAFDRGDMQTASAEAARYLRRVMPNNRSDREAGLDLWCGDSSGSAISTAPVQPKPNWRRSQIGGNDSVQGGGRNGGRTRRIGEGDAQARRRLEDAVDLYRQRTLPTNSRGRVWSWRGPWTLLGQSEGARKRRSALYAACRT